MTKRQKVIAVVGPTASGKSGLAIEIAKHFSGEIISADSMQIYKGMDIATAKPTADEMGGIPHHMISCIDSNTHFSVADYQIMAQKHIAQVAQNGHLPIVVGGTGLYIDTLLRHIQLSADTNDAQIRQKLYERLEDEGIAVLLNELKEIDPATGGKLHENDVKRVIRALEVYYASGKTMTQQNELSLQTPTPYDTLYIGLTAKDRDFLYERINRRVDEMLENGMLEEARAQYESFPEGTSVQAIGYKELIPYFQGEKSLEACIETLKQSTRRYAKRQLTWLRKNEAIHWLYIDEIADLKQEAFKLVEDFISRED